MWVAPARPGAGIGGDNRGAGAAGIADIGRPVDRHQHDGHGKRGGQQQAGDDSRRGQRARIRNSTAATTAPNRTRNFTVQTRNVNCPGMPAKSPLLSARRKTGQVPHAISPKTAAPARWKSKSKTAAARGRSRCSHSKKRLPG